LALDLQEPANHNFSSFFSRSEFERLKEDKVDTIINLAGKAHDTKNRGKAEAYFEINTGLTQKIFDYFLQSGASGLSISAL
jgi:nucleoside-diphosphate-sugar epimerase